MKVIRFILALSVVAAMLVSCEKAGPGEIAVQYVEMLDNGNYAEAVNHTYGCDSASAEYRDHMAMLYQQTVASVQKDCGKIKSVNVVKVDNHESEGYADVMLHIVFEKNLERDILISLVRHNDEWKMK